MRQGRLSIPLHHCGTTRFLPRIIATMGECILPTSSRLVSCPCMAWSKLDFLMIFQKI